MKSLQMVLTALMLTGIAVNAAAIPVNEIQGEATHRLAKQILGAGPPGAAIWIDLLVDSGETVMAGQKLAIQRSVQGEVVQEYTAGKSGTVIIVTRGQKDEPNSTILEIRILSEAEAMVDTAASP